MLFSSSDMSSYLLSSRSANSIKNKFFETGQRITSSQILPDEIMASGNGSRLWAFKNMVSGIERYTTTSAQASLKLESEVALLENVRDLTSTLGLKALDGVNSHSDSSMLRQLSGATQSFDSIVAKLNTSVAGSTLFAGNKLRSPPLIQTEQIIPDILSILNSSSDVATSQGAIDAYFNDPSGKFATAIYNGGSSDAPSLEVSNNVHIQFDIRADHNVIRNLLKNLATVSAIESGNFSGSEAHKKSILATSATEMINLADDLIGIQAARGMEMQRLEDAQIENTAIKNRLETKILGITSVDIYSESAHFNELEGQLQASFQVLNKLSTMTLANFMR